MTRTERQNLAIDKWRDAGGRNSLVMPTGTGKTFTALTAIKRVITKNPNFEVVVVVPTKVLKDQWEQNIKTFNFPIQVNVLIINTAASHKFNCDFLIIDELHRVNSLTNRRIFNNCSPKLILGLTATYERLDGLEKQVVDHFCPVCDTITIDEALENQWLSEYREYKVLLDVDLTEYKKANTEFIQHFSFFQFDFDLAMKIVSSVAKQREYAKAINCTLKEVQGHAYAWMNALQFRKRFVAEHPKKIEIAKQIINARKTQKIITFNSSIKQCELYDSGYIIHSNKTKKENQEILSKFANETSGQIHSSKMLIEGLDCPGLSVAIITGFNSSQVAHRQSIGRCIRKEEGKCAEIFTLVLRNTVEEQWFKKAAEDMNFIEINESELSQILKKKDLKNKNKVKQLKTKNDLLRF